MTTHAGNKRNVAIYISHELFNAIERERGLVPRSTFIEYHLNKALKIETKK